MRAVFLAVAWVLCAGAVRAQQPAPAAAAAPDTAAEPHAGSPGLTPAQVQGTSEPVVIRQTELDREVKRLAQQIRCVVCRGQSIQDSPSELAQEMRAVVREQLMAGRSEQEVKDYFVARYGQQVLLQPEPQGVNLLVYVLPVLVLLGGAVFVFLKARRLASADAREPAEHAGV